MQCEISIVGFKFCKLQIVFLTVTQDKQCIELRSDFAGVLSKYLNHQLSMPNNFHETDF